MHIIKSNGDQTDLKFLGNLKASEEYSWRSFSGRKTGFEGTLVISIFNSTDFILHLSSNMIDHNLLLL